jgi:hypothetical protein
LNEEKEEINLVFDGFGFSGSIFIANYAAARCFSLLHFMNPVIGKNKIGAIVSAGRGLSQPSSINPLVKISYIRCFRIIIKRIIKPPILIPKCCIVHK